MNWLARLKKSECVPETDATKPTKLGFVGFVGAIPEPFQKSTGDPATNDPQPLDREAWPERAAIAEYDGGLSRQDAEALADASCWPHSTAMNGAEIDTFTARLARFTDRGLILADAERLADKLVIRDREADDRRVCLECVHLRHGGRCGNWRAAGVAINAMDARLPGDFTAMLQRCDGYQSTINSPIQSIS